MVRAVLNSIDVYKLEPNLFVKDGCFGSTYKGDLEKDRFCFQPQFPIFLPDCFWDDIVKYSSIEGICFSSIVFPKDDELSHEIYRFLSRKGFFEIKFLKEGLSEKFKNMRRLNGNNSNWDQSFNLNPLPLTEEEIELIKYGPARI